MEAHAVSPNRASSNTGETRATHKNVPAIPEYTLERESGFGNLSCHIDKESILLVTPYDGGRFNCAGISANVVNLKKSTVRTTSLEPRHGY
jgi:hypothetical protein